MATFTILCYLLKNAEKSLPKRWHRRCLSRLRFGLSRCCIWSRCCLSSDCCGRRSRCCLHRSSLNCRLFHATGSVEASGICRIGCNHTHIASHILVIQCGANLHSRHQVQPGYILWCEHHTSGCTVWQSQRDYIASNAADGAANDLIRVGRIGSSCVGVGRIGSGCVGVSLALELPGFTFYWASDRWKHRYC